MHIDFISKQLNNHTPRFLGYKHEHAVLLPLVYYQDEWHILFQIRSQQVPQPGEVSFPGGRVETGETPLQAAIRETHEEIGFDPERINIIGEMDKIANGRRLVHCYVGELTDFELNDLVINKAEVERIFLKPLSYFLNNPAKHFRFNTERRFGEDFPSKAFKNIDTSIYKTSRSISRIPYYPVEEEVIWGLTAQLVSHFINIINEN